MNILHITSILPAPISRKKKENDILIRIAEEFEKQYSDSKHHFLLILPYSNSFLALCSTTWKEYQQLISKGFYEYNGFKIYVLGMPAFKSDRRIRKQLNYLGYQLNKKKINKILNDLKPNVIHAHNLRGNVELAEIIKQQHGINYVVTARNLNDYTLNKLKKGVFNPTKVLSLNHKNFETCLKNLTIPVELIPHPVDEEFFVDADLLRINDKPKFVSVCRLLALKNLDKVMHALATIDKDFTFDIYGIGPEEEKLKNLAKELQLLNKISFKGWVKHNDIKEVMCDYDLLIQPSYPETLGRVYFEAMAAGVPVIAAKNTGIDGFIKNGMDGYLVDHNKIEPIREVIINFMKMDSEKHMQLKNNAISFAKKYRWNDTLEKYYNLYIKK